MIAALLAAVALATHPTVSLSVSPARVTMSSGSVQTLRITNAGAAPVILEATAAGYALDLRGRARVVQARVARSWLSLRPRRLELAPGGSASLVVSAARVPGARPGEHDTLVLLTSAARSVGGVSVRMRLGVVVAVRVPGAVVRRLEVRRLRVRGRGRLDLLVANRGDVTERLSSTRLRVALRRSGRLLARLRPVPRELLPRTSGLVELRYSRRLRGWATAVVELGGLRRSFRVQL